MTGRPRRDESGAFLIVWALLLVAMLTMVAIVIDLGRLRDTRRQAQRIADLAAVAAGQQMAGGDVVNACKSAVRYVNTNTADLAALPEGPCATAFAPYAGGSSCDPALAPRQMVAVGGPYTLTVRNPVPDAELEDPNYTAALGTGTIESDGAPCERMRVTLRRTNPTLFAGVVGQSSLTTSATAVIRGFIGENPRQNAGLVVLERKNCEALLATGGLASVLVKGSIGADGKPRPGTIQVDTKALEASAGGNCSNAGGNPTSKYAVYGTQLNPAADRRDQPAIEAQAIGGAPGRIDMYALTANRLNTHAAYLAPTGVSPVPTPGVIASRRVVDKVYNAPVAGGPGRVTQLKIDSAALLSALNAAATACPLCNTVVAGGETWHVYPPRTLPGVADPSGVLPITPPAGAGAPVCSTNAATLIDVLASYPRVYVDCATLDVPNVRFSGQKVAIRGVLKIGSGRMAQFPNAASVVVGGCGGCTGGNTKGIDADGALLVNTGPSTPLVKQCNNGTDDDSDGDTDYSATPGLGDAGCQAASDWDELSCIENRLVGSTPPTAPSRLVVMTGPIETSSSAIVDLCQTFVLMADGNSLPYEDSSATTDYTCTGYTNSSGVVVETPCPRTNSYKGRIQTFGLIDWTAADQTSGPRDTNQPGQNFEDLALWTETSADSEIKGAGATITGGVFFFPNALMKFSGQASQFIDLNAQFVARRLELSGQGTLSMKPNPNDVVETPAPYFRLIR